MSDLSQYVPETRQVAAGLVALPSTMFVITPLRNALTRAANDSSSTFTGIYRKTFQKGLPASFQGGSGMVVASFPASFVIGPSFHIFNRMFGNSTAACVATGLSETLLFYGAETRNAQLASTGHSTQSALPWGRGVGLHAVRNIVAMSGLRIISDPLTQQALETCPNGNPNLVRFASETFANCFVAALSAPLHMVYSYRVTNSDNLSFTQILKKMYYDGNRLKPTCLRDISLRVVYSGSLYCLFGSLERAVISNWPGEP